MTEQVKLALVGCGGISGLHVKGYADLYERGCRDFAFTACCDVLEENARKRAKQIAGIQGSEPRVFTDTTDLVDSGVAEAADLCLPHWLHHTMAIALLEGGLHVLLEKPLGITVKASKRTIEAARKADRVLATAENVRRYPSSRAFQWALSRRKLIGEVLAAHVYCVHHGLFNLEDPAFKWRCLKLLTGGGMIMDSGAHFADMMLYLFGDVDEVYCSMTTNDTRIVKDAPVLGSAPVDVEDAWHAIIRFRCGVEVTWTYSRAFPGPGMNFARYYGTKGVIDDEGFVFHSFQGGGSVKLANDGDMSNDEVVEQYMASLADDEKARLFPYGCGDGFGIQIWDFCDAIRTGRKPDLDGEAGLRAKALCECCYESATTRRPVKYDDVVSGKVCEYQNPIDEYWDS